MHSNSYYHSTALSLYSTPSGLARVRMTARRVDAVWTAEESEHEPPRFQGNIAISRGLLSDILHHAAVANRPLLMVQHRHCRKQR